jgi:hypothetical protein
MPKPQRIRFFVSTPCQDAEILSMLERDDGDIEIFPRNGNNAELDGKNTKIEHQHISIHRSQETNGTTITTTFRASDNPIKMASFVKNSKEALLWPIIGKAMPHLSEPIYLLKSREQDKIINLFNEFDHNWTLMYFIFLQRKGGYFKPVHRFKLHVEDFEYFSVGVYATYLFVPPSPLGFMSWLMTSAPKNRGEIFGPFTGNFGASSFSSEKLEQALLQFSEDIARNHTRRFVSGYPNHPMTQLLKNRQSAFICDIPLNEENKDFIDYGSLRWTAPLETETAFNNCFVDI